MASLGIRFATFPHLPGTTMVSGFAGTRPGRRRRRVRAGPVRAGDRRRSSTAYGHRVRPNGAELIDQRYDFATGELLDALDLPGRAGDRDGRNARVLPAGPCRVWPRSMSRSGSIGLPTWRCPPASIPTGVPGFGDDHAQPQDQGPNEGVDGRLRWHSGGDISTLGMAYTTAFAGDALGGTHDRDARRPRPILDHLPRAGADGTGATGSACSRRSSRSSRTRDPTSRPAGSQPSARKRTLDGLRRENRAAWDELWRGRIEIDGADRRWQAITDASLFYLLSSTHSASLASTSLFGLAYWPNYHYYHGHVMWDIETFTVPPLLLLAPDAAHALLDYRFRHLTRGPPQRRDARLARRDVSMGELPAARRGVDPGRSSLHRGPRQRGHRPGIRGLCQCHRGHRLCAADRLAGAALRRRVGRLAGGPDAARLRDPAARSGRARSTRRSTTTPTRTCRPR